MGVPDEPDVVSLDFDADIDYLAGPAPVTNDALDALERDLRSGTAFSQLALRQTADEIAGLRSALRAEKEARALDAEKLATLERINLDLLGNLRAAEASAKRAEAARNVALDMTLPVLVAAAYRDAANTAKTHGVYPELNIWDGGPEWFKHGQSIAAAILASIPDDASAALARIRQEAEDEALERAAQKFDNDKSEWHRLAATAIRALKGGAK